jgi:hypothetical protein
MQRPTWIYDGRIDLLGVDVAEFATSLDQTLDVCGGERQIVKVEDRTYATDCHALWVSWPGNEAVFEADLARIVAQYLPLDHAPWDLTAYNTETMQQRSLTVKDRTVLAACGTWVFDEPQIVLASLHA